MRDSSHVLKLKTRRHRLHQITAFSLTDGAPAPPPRRSLAGASAQTEPRRTRGLRPACRGWRGTTATAWIGSESGGLTLPQSWRGTIFTGVAAL